MLDSYAEARTKFGRSFDMFGAEIQKNPEFGEALSAFEKLGDICRDIRRAFGTDQPEAFVAGEELNGMPVTEETVIHVTDIHQKYTATYAIVKDMFKELGNDQNEE